jgi:hypothetical protein
MTLRHTDHSPGIKKQSLAQQPAGPKWRQASCAFGSNIARIVR